MTARYKYSKYALLILFVGYLGCLMAFSHVHIENGHVYVHAHPYSDAPDSPKHHHTYSAFQVLDALSSFMVEAQTFLSFIPTPYLNFQIFQYNFILEVLASLFGACVIPRGPPSVF